MDDPDFLLSWHATAAASQVLDTTGFQHGVAACQVAATLALDDPASLDAYWRHMVAMRFEFAEFSTGLGIIHKMSALGHVERIHIPQIMAVETLMKDHTAVMADSTAFAVRLLAEPGIDSGADIEVVGPMALLNPAPVVDGPEARVWRRVLTQALVIAKSRGLRAVLISDLMAPFCAPTPKDRLVLSFRTHAERAGTLNVNATEVAEFARFEWHADGAWHDDGMPTQNPATLRRKLESLLYPQGASQATTP